jgi:hypothetical protein
MIVFDFLLADGFHKWHNGPLEVGCSARWSFRRLTMRITLQSMKWIVGVFLAVAVFSASPVQAAERVVLGRYTIYSPKSARGRVRPPVFLPVPIATITGVQTSVMVPDGGSVTIGGYSNLSEGRSEFGAPVPGKVPILGRGFRNVGTGRSATSRKIIIKVRVIDLREEEYRQTGVRRR